MDTDWVSATVSDYSLRTKFNINDAREMMLREGSKLRKIYVSGISYTVSEIACRCDVYSLKNHYRGNGFQCPKVTGLRKWNSRS